MLTRSQKEEQVADLRSRFERSTGIFIADYRGITVDEANDLRAKLRSPEAGGEVDYQVTKNSVLRHVVKDTPFDVLTERFNGPTAIAISYGDPAAVAKVLVGYAKDLEPFEVKGAFLDGKSLTESEIQTLATLPSLSEIRGSLVGLLQAPATKLVRLLKEPGSQIARLMEARRSALESAG